MLQSGCGGAVFLRIDTSPTMNAMDGIGVSLPSSDIFSSYYNPANPVLLPGFSYQKADFRTPWFSGFSNNIFFKNKVETVGFRFRKSNFFFPVSNFETSLYSDTSDEYGLVSDSFHMKSDAISFSAWFSFPHFHLRIAVGRTDKKAEQHSGMRFDPFSWRSRGSSLYDYRDFIEVSSYTDFYDWGYLISFPLSIRQSLSGSVMNVIPYPGTPVLGCLLFSKSDPPQAWILFLWHLPERRGHPRWPVSGWFLWHRVGKYVFSSIADSNIASLCSVEIGFIDAFLSGLISTLTWAGILIWMHQDMDIIWRVYFTYFPWWQGSLR